MSLDVKKKIKFERGAEFHSINIIILKILYINALLHSYRRHWSSFIFDFIISFLRFSRLYMKFNRTRNLKLISLKESVIRIKRKYNYQN